MPLLPSQIAPYGYGAKTASSARRIFEVTEIRFALFIPSCFAIGPGMVYQQQGDLQANNSIIYNRGAGYF